jgi:hypothetical protein
VTQDTAAQKWAGLFCQSHQRGPDESGCCPICENTEEWVLEKAKWIINTNPDIVRWGVVMPVEDFAQALREALALGYVLGTGKYDGTY